MQQQTPSTSGAAESLGEYAELKKQLLARAQRAGGFVALYLFLSQGLVVSAVALTQLSVRLSTLTASCDRLLHLQATICSSIGSTAGYLYLRLLIADVDKISADTEVPIFQAQRVMTQPLRALMYGNAAYR